MAEEDTLEIIVTLDDQASEALKNLASVLEQTGGNFDKVGGAVTRTHVANLTYLSGLRSVTQGMSSLTAGLGHFVDKDNAVLKSLQDVNAVMQIMVGPMRMIAGAMAMYNKDAIGMIATNQKLQYSLLGVAAAAGAILAIYGALNASTDQQRMQFSALAGVMVGMTAISWALAAAQAGILTFQTMGVGTIIAMGVLAGTIATLGTYAAAKYMHSGGVVGSDEQLTVLQKGEGVLSKRQMQEGGGTSSTILNIYGSVDSDQRVHQIRRELDFRDKMEAMRKGVRVVTV